MSKSSATLNTFEILNRIVSKGGLLGQCANLYLNDDKQAHLFILECSEQCNYKLFIEHFGTELVNDILDYSELSRRKIVS